MQLKSRSKLSIFRISKNRSPFLDIHTLLLDPINIATNSGMHARVDSMSTASAPRDETRQNALIIDRWSTGVALTGILTALHRQPSADHVLGNLGIDS